MQLFVLRGYQRVTISNCSSSVIFVGAVATSVVMENCKRTTVVTSCEIFQVGRTEDCTLFLQTLLPVEIFGASHNLYLAPLNVAYKGAAEHQRACGLDFSTNDSQWATPQVLNKTATWSLLPPSQFYQLHIPSVLGFEEVTTESKQDILSAPRAYQEVLDAGVARAEHVRTVLADPGMCMCVVYKRAYNSCSGRFNFRHLVQERSICT